jgi:hypothetical protein
VKDSVVGGEDVAGGNGAALEASKVWRETEAKEEEEEEKEGRTKGSEIFRMVKLVKLDTESSTRSLALASPLDRQGRSALCGKKRKIPTFPPPSRFNLVHPPTHPLLLAETVVGARYLRCRPWRERDDVAVLLLPLVVPLRRPARLDSVVRSAGEELVDGGCRWVVGALVNDGEPLDFAGEFSSVLFLTERFFRTRSLSQGILLRSQ